jgi:hypothetical protein
MDAIDRMIGDTLQYVTQITLGIETIQGISAPSTA